MEFNKHITLSRIIARFFGALYICKIKNLSTVAATCWGCLLILSLFLDAL